MFSGTKIFSLVVRLVFENVESRKKSNFMRQGALISDTKTKSSTQGLKRRKVIRTVKKEITDKVLNEPNQIKSSQIFLIIISVIQ